MQPHRKLQHMYYYEEKSYDSKPRKAFRRFRFEYTTYISPLLCYFLFHSSQNRRTLSIVNFNLRENRELWIVLEQILPFRGPSESSCFEHLKKG